jgi:hypothetical protein
MKYSGHTYKFYLNHYFFDRPFEYGDCGIFKLLRWMQNLNQPTWDHQILYVEGTLEDKQLLMRQLLRESNEDGGRLNVKIHVLYYGGNS